MHHWNMPRGKSGGTVLPNLSAERAVQKFLADEECAFNLVKFSDFKKSFQGSSLRSSAYQNYLVLCHGCSRYHAGWMVCPYVRNGICSVSEGLMEIKTSIGETNRFARHIRTHEQFDLSNSQKYGTLSMPCRTDISRSSMLAVVLDLRPLSFTENHEGMNCLLRSVFEVGQSIPLGVTVEKKTYIPSRTAMCNSMKKMVEELRHEFRDKHMKSILSLGGAISTNGVTLKAQNKHYYDFTIHHFIIRKPQTPTDSPIFTIRATSIVLVEGPNIPNAANIRACLNDKLINDCSIDFGTMQKNFTFVTDGGAVMANVAGSSISRSACDQGPTWMRCYIHVLNNIMKGVIAKCEKSSVLGRAHHDFNAIKK